MIKAIVLLVAAGAGGVAVHLYMQTESPHASDKARIEFFRPQHLNDTDNAPARIPR